MLLSPREPVFLNRDEFFPPVMGIKRGGNNQSIGEEIMLEVQWDEGVE